MATTGILRAGYHPLDDFTEHTQSQIWTGSGAPICWQATATVDGKPWRDSGSGPCPPVVRVPRGPGT